MNTDLQLLLKNLDDVLPDYKIIADLREIIREGTEGNQTHIEINETWISVPVQVPIVMITKAFFKEYFDGVGFGTYKVLVSLGPPVQKKSGLMEPEYCFSTLYYNNDAELITLDFHSEMR